MTTRINVITLITSAAGLFANTSYAQSRAEFEPSARQANLSRAQSRAEWEPSSRSYEVAPIASRGAPAVDEVSRAAPRDDYPAATNAIEISVGTGYAQAFGKVGNGIPQLSDIGQAGGALQIALGYRVLPQLTLGVYGSGSAFSRGDVSDSSTHMYSASAGVQADWHFLPVGERFDPWVSVGTGWRGYWLHSDSVVPGRQVAGTTSLQGLQLAKLQLGVDYRVAPAIAISPVIGADLTMFLTESPAGANGYSNIDSPQVNTFVFAGLLGRFDIATGSQGRSSVARAD